MPPIDVSLAGLLLRWARNRYVRSLLYRFPVPVFQALHAWPGTAFPWTDKRVVFFLSFDCDTPDDAVALPAMLALLERYHILASFALIGEEVLAAPAAYRQIVAAGHEVFNHGYSRHMAQNSAGEYQSNLFYEELTPAQIEQEIVLNHACLRDVLEVEAVGFRTPHFGTFQQPEQMALLHSLLRRYGYRYSSSTLMWHARQRGYLRSRHSMIEFPLSAIPGLPLSVFDSWTLLRAPGCSFAKGDFLRLFQQMIDAALTAMQPTLINVYFDPAHVAGLAEFAGVLEILDTKKEKIWMGTYNQALRQERRL